MSTPEPPRRRTRSDVLKAYEVAEILDMAPSTIYALAAAGDIPGARRLGRSWVFSNAQLTKWLDE